MYKSKWIQITLSASLLMMSSALVAQAATKSWVSSNGGGVTCSRALPCATFQIAHDATTPGGEINCVDAGDYGQVIITKAISIVCENTEASIVAVTSGITVNAGPTDVVTLRGIDIEGNGAGLQGINFAHGAALHIFKVHIRNFRNNNPATAGILFQPNAYAELYVADSYITDNGGSGAFSGGIVLRPFDNGRGNVIINRVLLENNAVGIVAAPGPISNGSAMNVIVRDSVVTGSAGDGIAGVSGAGQAAVSIFVEGCMLSTNFGSGISVNGAAMSGVGSVTARIGNTTIAHNVTGASAVGGGVLQSFKNNQIFANLSDGTPITAVPAPGGPLQ